MDTRAARVALNNSVGYSLSKAKRWRCADFPDKAVLKNTKSEAIAWFKQVLGLERLPQGTKVEAF